MGSIGDGLIVAVVVTVVWAVLIVLPVLLGFGVLK